MGISLQFGDAGGPSGSMTVHTGAKVVAWETSGVAGARVYLIDASTQRVLFAEGTQGMQPMAWYRVGQPLFFQLLGLNPDGSEGPSLATATVDLDGRVTGENTSGTTGIEGGTIPPPPAASLIPGIPNSYLWIAAAVVGLGVLRKKF